MTCQYGVIEWVEYTKDVSCDLGLPNCDDCPFGPFQYDALLVIIEDGMVNYLAHSGNWATEGQIDYLISFFSDEIGPGLEMEPDADEAIEVTKADPKRVFVVTLKDPSFCCDDGYWDMNYGYVNSECHVEWEDVKVEEI